MKNSLFLLGLMALPTVAFAGGAGNLDLYNAANSAAQNASVTNAPTGLSTENPLNILETRENADADQLRYSFGYIPNSFWAQYSGNLQDINGFVEAEEYFGETRRDQFTDATEREGERQTRAQNKANRLRFVGQ